MRRTHGLTLAAVVAGLGLVGCGADGADPAPTPTSQAPAPAADPQVVSYEGLREIQFGDQRVALERDHGLAEDPSGCGPRFPDHPSAAPVLADDRLVLLWLEPPLRTPEGIQVGSPLEEVRSAYPAAEELPAPPGSFQFDGVLAVAGDRAYLFLHDGATVQKLIVGYEEYARSLFHDGFGTC